METLSQENNNINIQDDKITQPTQVTIRENNEDQLTKTPNNRIFAWKSTFQLE